MSMEPQDELVTVQTTVGWECRQVSKVWFGNRLVVWREVWDRPPVLGEGVRLVSGMWPACGGSPSVPQLGFQGPVVVELSGVPRADLAGMEPEGWHVEDDEAARQQTLTREVLRRERERLLAEVAEIDGILQESTSNQEVEAET